MPPKESSPLIGSPGANEDKKRSFGILPWQESFGESTTPSVWNSSLVRLVLLIATSIAVVSLIIVFPKAPKQYTGPYQLVERQEGQDFFQYYDFYQGADSLGSAGYNTYTGKKDAERRGLINVTQEKSHSGNVDYVYIQSAPTDTGPRASVRLEGKRRFDRGLFVLDVNHMPAGCGVWPAFWLTDEDAWPNNGEIDIVEGVNNQTRAKTALHTSDQCSMFAHVPDYAKTGIWDSSTGLPDTFTGNPDFVTHVPADNCWVMAPHQWANQGCVAMHEANNTIGEPLNAQGGGVYVLEWDPDAGYIKSWVFTPHTSVPENLERAMETANEKDDKRIIPEPDEWGLPYAYFAIGEESGCSSDHFQNMRIIFNLAFCGTVSGNRFFRDCPALSSSKKDPVKACNAYIETNPKALEEAYWKIRGVYVYERDAERS